MNDHKKPALKDLSCPHCLHEWLGFFPSGLESRTTECPRCHTILPIEIADYTLCNKVTSILIDSLCEICEDDCPAGFNVCNRFKTALKKIIYLFIERER